MVRLATLICAFQLGLTQSASADGVAAAGRIDFLHTGGSCSGVLVAPHVVATAAHCTPEASQAELNVAFQPAAPVDAQKVVKGIRHPLYDPDSPREDWKLRFDIGVITLAEKITGDEIETFPIGDDAVPGETLFIVSWRKPDGPRPRQRACPVLSVGVRGLVTLGCAVVGGESGAPVLRKTEAGLELVAILSSRARLLEQPVAQATNVRLRLPPLLALVNADSGP